MKKAMLLAAGLLTAGSALRAQIILKGPDYYRSIRGTVDSLRDAVPSSLPAPMQHGTNVSWDLTGLSYLPGWDTIHYYAPSTSMPMAMYAFDKADSLSYSYRFNARMQQGIAGNGFLTYGMHIDSASYTLGDNTANYNDTLKLFTQDVLFSSPDKDVALPATYPQNWQSTARGIITGQVTCNVLHYNKTPYALHTTRIQQDTVTGWGQMRLKDERGITSAAMDVLQVRSYLMEVDSTHIDGAPVDHFEGLEMDLPQLIYTNVYQEKYHRIGEVTPLVTVTYGDYKFTQVKEVRVHQRRLAKLGVDHLPLQATLTVFPNPVTGNHFSVGGVEDLSSGAYTYQVMSVSGQVVASGKLQMATINLPAPVDAGMFYLQLSRNNNVVAVKPLTIVK